MKTTNTKILTLIISMFLIVGCGGDGSKGEVLLDSLLVTVPDNISPVANVDKLNISVIQGQSFTLDASNSTDEDGNIVSYLWQLANGTNLAEGQQLNYKTSSLNVGTYKLRLIVTDDDGATGVIEVTVTVQARPQPAPTPDEPTEPDPTDTTPPVITLNGESTITLPCATAYAEAGASATDETDGSVTVTTTGTVDANSAGDYTLTYTAQDSAGNTATLTRTVTVVPISHNGTSYCTVTSPYTNKVWLDRNLGAARVCEQFDDSACYGDYYQWGRNFDGHQDSTSGTTATQATDVNTAGSDFITSNSANSYDWAKTADSDGSLRTTNWSKTDGSSVCPVGFRVPNITELRAETLDNGVTNRDTAFSNFLALPSAGYRYGFSGSMIDVGSWGVVWSSSAGGSNASYLDFGSDNAGWISLGIRAYGLSVRCLRD